MNEGEFWVKIWKTFGVVVCVLVTLAVGSCQSSKYQIRKAIELGADPMEVACAFDNGNTSEGAICALALMRKNG